MAVVVLVGDPVAAHVDVEGLAVVVSMGVAIDLVELEEDVLAGHGPDACVILGSIVRIAGPYHGIALNQPLCLVLGDDNGIAGNILKVVVPDGDLLEEPRG